MRLFRLSKQKYSMDLSGKGAELAGGRWNSRGKAVLYTSQSRALCTVEIAVHTPLANIPTDYELVEIAVPEDSEFMEIDLSILPSDWNSIPHAHTTQEIGDRFITENNFLLFKVPSVAVPGEFNFLINPAHKRFCEVEVHSITPFEFDSRLFLK